MMLQMMHHGSPARHNRRAAVLAIALLLAQLAISTPLASAAGGVLNLATRDEATGQAVPARLELRNAAGRKPGFRRGLPSGPGIVLDRSLDLALADGQYRFRLVRGPEYRIISGEFTLERGAADQRLVTLPRMVDMQAAGYLSGDMAASDAAAGLPLRMAGEDLHVAAVIASGKNRDLTAAAQAVLDRHPSLAPLWLDQPAVAAEELLFYPGPQPLPASDAAASVQLAAVAERSDLRVALANPFAWQVPIWLASGRIDGVFLLGNWLREGTRIERVPAGRPPREIGFNGPHGPGRYGEAIYWRLLEAGFEIAPLAGTGAGTGPSPAAANDAVGYNRIYAIGPRGDAAVDDRQPEPIASQSQWYDAAWAGRSVVTNGPLLRPTLGGMAPGHRFTAHSGERLEMSVELHLAVRDPVEYLEVIHNGQVVYSARLDEFAEAGGVIPPLQFERSGWVLVRVVTGHEEHFRAAISAPWYIHFDDTPRISRRAVEFFGQWLQDCEGELKKLPAAQLAAHIEPVRMAREFWNQRLRSANAD